MFWAQVVEDFYYQDHLKSQPYLIQNVLLQHLLLFSNSDSLNSLKVFIRFGRWLKCYSSQMRHFAPTLLHMRHRVFVRATCGLIARDKTQHRCPRQVLFYSLYISAVIVMTLSQVSVDRFLERPFYSLNHHSRLLLTGDGV